VPIQAVGRIGTELEGPGRLVPVRGKPFHFRYEAPLIPWTGNRARVTVFIERDPDSRASLDLPLVRPVFARPRVVPEVPGLLEIQGYWTRQDFTGDWNLKDVPEPGGLFRSKQQNHRWRFRVRRARVLQVEVDVYPADAPGEVVHHLDSEKALDVKLTDEGLECEFREQFREGRGEYRVVIYVWTSKTTVERRTLRVLRAPRGE
jgi:hypothetical protein